jgi:glutathione synthase
VQPGERNVFDQRYLEYELLERYGTRVIRLTLSQLSKHASLSSDNTLLITRSSSASSEPIEIAVVYFRAGYTPTDYHTPEHYKTRFMLEKSRAINCPSIPLQLAGGKKVQQVLAEPGVLDRFLLAGGDNSFSQERIAELRDSWMGMWGLDLVDSKGDEVGIAKALENHPNLVLKPQREGGGNNVYKGSIPSFLSTLPRDERQAWIAMELIKPPAGLSNYLVRATGEGVGVIPPVKAEVISELGIFGWAIFGEGRVVDKSEDGGAGWLVRTKGKESDEGGVATGFSVLDSIVLVD